MSAETKTTSSATFDGAAKCKELGARTDALVNRGCTDGADQVEAFGISSESISVNYENGDLKLTQVDEQSSIGMRAIRDMRMGFSSTNQTGEAALDSLASNALELASISPADDHNVLPTAGATPRTAAPADPAICSWTIEEANEAAHSLVERARAVDPRISLDKASLSLSRSAYSVSNSCGIQATESEASISLSLFGMAVDGDDVGGFDYWGNRTRELSGLEAIIEDSITRFTSAALGNLGAGAAESYNGPVLFSPAAFASVFVSPIVSASSAVAVQRGRSALAGKIGERVADSRLSIIDDPTDLGLAGNCTFDREGVATSRFPILEAGVLQGWLYNAYAAHIDGVSSTGHAAGGTRAAPGLGTHSIVVGAGDGGDGDAMLAALGRGLVVQRFSGTVDPASGDFSGVAKSARWVEDGRIERGVRETLISGNAFVLLNQILSLSSESESVMGSMRAPWALVDGLSVTAG
ncbi:MAG: PmbA protein [Planctomycetota bacterium]|jgi:PmbA protein